MTKRPRSWDSDFDRQSKFQVNEIMVNAKDPDFMKKVYDKTYELLFKGAQRPLEPMEPHDNDGAKDNDDMNCIDVDENVTVFEKTKDAHEMPLSVGNCGSNLNEVISNPAKKYHQLRIDRMIWGEELQMCGCGIYPRG